MFVQQKLLTPTPSKQGGQDNPAASMTQSMQYTMPLMFGLFSLQFPSGLSIYFILANLIGIVQGLYMRRVTDRDKAERAASGKPVYVIDAEEDKPVKATPAKSKQSVNGSGATKSKSTSGQSAAKRKKRSAKR